MKPGGIAALALAAIVFVGGSVMGFSLLTSAADVTEPVATCAPRTIATGQKLTPNLITVDVLNGSRTAGLANRVSIQLQRRGFLAGTIANNADRALVTSDVLFVTSDKSDPRVRLVAAQFSGNIVYAPPTAADADPDRVVVIVGRNWADRELRKESPLEVAADRDVSVCVPIVPAA